MGAYLEITRAFIKSPFYLCISLTRKPDFSPANTLPLAAEKDPSLQPEGVDPPGVQIVQIDGRQVHADAEKMLGSFEAGYNQGDENLGDDDDELSEDVHNLGVVDTPRTHDALAWVDKFILDTRQKSGQATENSVLKLWKVRILFFCSLFD